MQAKHPIQPLSKDENGIIRFKSNEIVKFLLKHGGFDMNALMCMDFTVEDCEQFAQLIGYTHSGYGDLPHVSRESYDTAEHMFNEVTSELEARNAVLRNELKKVKEQLRGVASAITSMADDLE